LNDPKLCVSIQVNTTEQTISEIQSISESVDYIELRLDYQTSPVDLNEIRKATTKPLIATNRCQEQGGYAKGNDTERLQLLIEAAETGFEYIDLELTSPKLVNVVETIHENGGKVILSHHDFNETPSLEYMKKTISTALQYGGDICKIIGTAQSYEDNVVYLRFLKENHGHIAFAMGKPGVISRIVAPLLGAPFTYAAQSTGRECAPGQLTSEEMTSLYSLLRVDP